MATKKQPDWEALERAILIELERQGFEFAEVHYRADYPDNPVFVNVRTEDEINPKYLDSVRIVSQLYRPRNIEGQEKSL